MIDTKKIAGFSASVFLQDTETKHTILDVQKSLVFRSKVTDPPVNDLDQLNNSSPLFVPSQDDDDGEVNLKPELRAVYDGFTIYGKTLWLVVSSTNSDHETRVEHLEEWVSSSREIASER